MTPGPARPGWSLARALIVTNREVRDQMRDWRIVVPVVALTLLFPLLMNFTAGQILTFVGQYGANIVGERLIPFLLMVVGFFPISVCLVIALESFVGEKERFSLEPLLSSPLADTELYLGKLLAATLPPLLASYLGIAVYLAGLAFSVQWYPNPGLLAQIVALTTVQALVMVAGAVVVSSQTTSVRAANLLASFIIIPFALLVQGESVVMFWGQYDVLWAILVGLILILAALVRLGVRLFNREELLGRDLDELNVRNVVRTFASAFVGAGRGAGLLGWYRREVAAALGRIGQPLLVVSAALLAAFAFGYSQAPAYPLPLKTDAAGLAPRIAENLAAFGFLSPAGVAWVFGTNVRALALASAAGAFSWGVLGLVLLMVPLALAGFFTGLMAQAGISPMLFLGAFVLPHGVLEIPAALITGAAVLRLGMCLLAPPPGLSLGEAWLSALADWAKLMLAVVTPLLAGAAVIEALVTPWVALTLFGH